MSAYFDNTPQVHSKVVPYTQYLVKYPYQALIKHNRYIYTCIPLDPYQCVLISLSPPPSPTHQHTNNIINNHPIFTKVDPVVYLPGLPAHPIPSQLTPYRLLQLGHHSIPLICRLSVPLHLLFLFSTGCKQPVMDIRNSTATLLCHSSCRWAPLCPHFNIAFDLQYVNMAYIYIYIYIYINMHIYAHISIYLSLSIYMCVCVCVCVCV